MKANKKDICWHISSNKIMTEKRAGLVLNCVGTHQHTEKAKPLRSKVHSQASHAPKPSARARGSKALPTVKTHQIRNHKSKA